MRAFILVFFVCNSYTLLGQYHFSGTVSQENAGKSVYLSLVEDYRKSSRIYLEQIVRKVAVDSLGHFSFEGNNLLHDNRIYRIHLDGCSDDSDARHFLGQCNSSKSVLFIANNQDTVDFPTSFEDQSLCSITSTNPKSSVLLDIENLKEEMVFDFTEFRSDANRKLNSEKWFNSLQSIGKDLNEPLAELYIYDFLSDKRNETYAHYLEDISLNGYYQQLLTRLKKVYPTANFTRQYEAEINTDLQLASFHTTKTWSWKWVLIGFLAVSLLLNFYFLIRAKSKASASTSNLLQQLTPQEQKIVHHILQDKSNKEIASELFVSHSTIKTHINNLYKKMGVTSRQEIVTRFKK